MPATLERPERLMAKERKNTPVRIDDESLRWARIAASYKGLTLADYVSEALLQAAKADVQRSHAEITAGEDREGATKGKGKGGQK
jgi:uncharacterized protein (DUF1778 family)